MRPKGYRKVHEVPKNAQTAQMHPKYLTGPKIASSDQSTESVQSENTASGRKVFQVLSLLVMLLQRARTWLLFFLVWQIHSKGAVGRKHLWRGHMSDKVLEERNEELWASTTNQWSSVRNIFFAPSPKFTLHCILDDSYFFNSFLFLQAWKQIFENGNNQADLPGSQN